MAKPPAIRDYRVLLAGILLCAAVGVAVVLTVPTAVRLLHPVKSKLLGRKTVAERVEQYGPEARARLAPHFQSAGVAYPPGEVMLVGLKEEKLLEVYANNAEGVPVLVVTYPILAASGGPGPKLKEGDRQVPEGLYRVEGLNPNSRFHLSIKVDYPNAFDRANAEAEGRTNLGGDIFIHGGAASVGCLAIGDEKIEELFVLVAESGIDNVKIILTPLDPRTGELAPASDEADWRGELYAQITEAIYKLPRK